MSPPSVLKRGTACNFLIHSYMLNDVWNQPILSKNEKERRRRKKKKKRKEKKEKEKTNIRNLHCHIQQLDHITWKSAPVTAQQAAFVSS